MDDYDMQKWLEVFLISIFVVVAVVAGVYICNMLFYENGTVLIETVNLEINGLTLQIDDVGAFNCAVYVVDGEVEKIDACTRKR